MAEFKGLISDTQTAALPQDGEMVGHFLLQEHLGSGGMGEVFRAYDTRLKRSAAIKRLSDRLQYDVEARSRFLKEAERASQLNHPHIASIYELLEDNGETYLVMEYIEGHSLRQKLNQGFSLDQFISIAIQCLDALSSAHQSGILHCDLKPENIMLDSSGNVKLLDFGLARHLPRSSQSSTLDATGYLAGTPGYMAPELLLRNVYDQRTDIFSLGVIFYEILTGFNPFHASTLPATLDRILHETPTKISISNPSVPSALEAIIVKMMAKSPERRYQTVAELIVEFDQLCPGNARHQVPSLTLRRNFRFRFLIGALLCVLAGYTTRQYPVMAVSPAAPRSVLVADFDVYGDSPNFDGVVREALSTALQQSSSFNVIPRPRVYEALVRMQRPDLTRVDENLGRELCRREDVNLLLGGSIAHLGDTFQITVRASDPHHEKALFSDQVHIRSRNDFLAQLDALVLRVRARLGELNSVPPEAAFPLAKVTTTSLEALQLYSQAIDRMSRGKLADAIANLKLSTALDPKFAMAHLRLGQCYAWGVGKNEAAVKELLLAYNLRSNVTDRERLWIESQYFNIQEKYEESAQALAMLLQKYPDDAGARRESAMAYFNLGKVDLAIEEARLALKLDPNSSAIFTSLFFFLVKANRNDDAIALYNASAAHTIPDPHMSWGIGLAYLGKGDVTRARKEFAKLQQGSGDDRDLSELYLAVVDLYEGEIGLAIKKLEAGSLSDLSEAGGKRLPTRYYLIGRSRLMQRDFRRAVIAAQRILRTDPSNLQTVDLLSAGVILAHAGNTRLAGQALEKIKAIHDSAPSEWNESCFYALQGEIALAQSKPHAALSSFHSALASYPDPMLHFGLARAYEQANDLRAAAQEWQLSLDAQGEILQNGFPPDLVLAHLGLARVYRALNEIPQARAHYQAVLEFWKNGDDLQDFREASSQFNQLTSAYKTGE